MASLLLARALICWLAVGGVTSVGIKADSNLRQISETNEGCTRCDRIFTMLETVSSGERLQQIQMVERGEPKSGTTFMYHWAHGALIHTCNFLNDWFGSESCQLHVGQTRGMFHTPEEVSLSFDPRLGGDDAKCSCEDVGRVEISVTDERKHSLPVARSCAWQHPSGLAKHEVDCLSADGGPAENFNDILLCMDQPGCEITDDRHQFVVMRDPRAAAVSTFFHEENFPSSKKPTNVGGDIYTLDEFTLAIAPVLCQWVALRYLIFSTILGQKSAIFWYEDAFRDARKWHFEWMAAVGVNLPEPVIEAMADAALREDFDFLTMGKNVHPGTMAVGEPEKTHTPSWHEMLRPETLEALDAIAREWLPPAVLEQLNVPEG